jgi:cystinosin
MNNSCTNSDKYIHPSTLSTEQQEGNNRNPTESDYDIINEDNLNNSIDNNNINNNNHHQDERTEVMTIKVAFQMALSQLHTTLSKKRTVVIPCITIFCLVFALFIALGNDGNLLPVTATYPMEILSVIIGYTYFLCWSVSFYPQLILNYQRKNTTGLSPDFSILNVVGFGCYSIYVGFLFWSPIVREQYDERFHDNDDAAHDDATAAADDSHDPAVQSNDVAFAIHAFILSMVQVGQIIYYQERRRNMVSSILSMIHSSTKYFLIGCVVLCIIYGILVGFKVNNLIFLDFLYMLSSIKLTITIIKYIPQVVLNYQRKSTVGWNIWNILLDFSGGSLSLLQLVLDAYIMNDFTAITGNFVKLGLSFVSLFFDVSIE